MACDTVLKPRQTKVERQAEVRKRMSEIDRLLVARRVQMKVSRTGAVSFVGLSESDRDGLTDACIFHTLSRTGSAAARMELQRAEQLQGRVSRHGVHTHDGVTYNAH